MKRNLKNIFKFIIFTLVIMLALVSNFAYAQDAKVSGKTSDATVSGKTDTTKTTASQPLVKLQNPLKVNSIEEVIYLGIDLLIYVGVAFSIIAIIFVGFQFVMAQGNPKEIDVAKKRFLNIIIGLAVLISSKVIVEIVKNTFIQAGVVDRSVFNSPK